MAGFVGRSAWHGTVVLLCCMEWSGGAERRGPREGGGESGRLPVVECVWVPCCAPLAHAMLQPLGIERVPGTALAAAATSVGTKWSA